MSKAGQKILAGLRDAVNGNFSRVTIEGQTWVRVFPGIEDSPMPKADDPLDNPSQITPNQAGS